MSMFHRDAPTGDIHKINQWSYGDSEARESATGFASTDVGKVALEEDTLTYWILTDHDPITWQLIGDGESISDHIADTTDAHAASAITNTPSGNLVATTVQGALDEIQTELDSVSTTASAAQPGDADLTALAALSSTGLVARTAANTYAERTITGTANEVSVANGDGVSGAPTIGIADDPVLPGTGAVTVPSGTEAQRPGTPANGMLRYNSDSGQFEGYTGAWGAIAGSGGGGSGKNYIEGADSPTATTGWTVYANTAAGTAPDDFGGTPSGNVTWTRNTTTPLGESADFLLTKDANDRQGEGVYYEFTPERGDYASVFAMTGKALTSADYDDGDIQFYLAFSEDDFATILEVKQGSPHELLASLIAGDFYSEAQVPVGTSVKARFCIHIASTNASAYTVQMNRISVGPNQKTMGVPVTNYESYTGTFAGMTPTSVDLWKRQTGDSVQAYGSFVAGSVAASEFRVPLPGTIDPVKVPTRRAIGTLVYHATSGQHYQLMATGGNNYLTVAPMMGSSDPSSDMNGNAAASNGFTLTFWTDPIPIQGWSSPVQLSSQNDGRKIAARYYASAGFTTGTSSGRYAWDTKEFDTHNAVTPGGTSPNSTWLFTAPRAGYYRLGMCAVKTGTPGSNGAFYVNTSGTGATASHWVGQLASTDEFQSGSTLIYLPAGGTFFVDNGTGAANNYAAWTEANWITIESVDGSQTLAASSTVAARYTKGSGQTSLNNEDVVVTYGTKTIDTHGAWDTTNNEYTCPAPGLYRVRATVQFLAIAAGSYGRARIRKNGTLYKEVYTRGATSLDNFSVEVADIIECVAGDTIDITGGSDDTAFELGAGTGICSVSIERVGL